MEEIERRQKIYQELLEEAKRLNPKRLPNEFTVLEFSKDAGFSVDKAREFLYEQVEIGKLSMRKTKRFTYFSVV